MQLSTSYFRQSEINSPGTMISPSPRILNLILLFQSRQGNCSLRGRSILLATVTITSDWYTQQRSYKNSSQRVGTAILKDRRPAYFNAVIAKHRANRLLSHQCLEIMKRMQRVATKAGQSRYLEAFYIHLKYFSYRITPFWLSLSCQATILWSRVLPQIFVAKAKIRSKRMLILISLMFLMRKYSERSTTQPRAGYFIISQQFSRYFYLLLLVFSYYSHSLICLQEALPRLTERMQPVWTASPALSSSCAKMGQGRMSWRVLSARRRVSGRMSGFSLR